MDEFELIREVSSLAHRAGKSGFHNVSAVLHFLASIISLEDNGEELDFLASYSKLKSDSCLKRARENMDAKAQDISLR